MWSTTTLESGHHRGVIVIKGTDLRPRTVRENTQTAASITSFAMSGLRLISIFLVLLAGFELQKAEGTAYSDKVLMNSSMYNYNMQSHSGPPMWKDQCYGERQSPINLDDVESIPTEFPLLEWTGHWNEREEGFILRNTWHSAEIAYTGEAPFIRGGPLTSEYVLAQVHFHWGNSPREGSEHSLDTHFYGMEAHLVHYNTEFGSVEAAAGHLDGLAVVGIFFKSSRGNNQELNGIVTELEKIIEGDSSTRIDGDAMEWLEAYADLQNYYTYSGSLTTPPCSEIVTWIVMKDPVLIGERQIEEFKKLKGHEGNITSNVRPVQELKGRQVFHSNYGFSRNSASIRFAPSLSGLIGMYLLFVLLFTQGK
ncbi:carbonic anhydrase 2-like [Neocloeon triangulifer]|uniref:carbonic anhydrase 2-like n=1 Tax=Neocloeon triangulifer TaxID=2078957 RepID=UPI00286F7AF5|nr:carbonic anhydrase 2-like [Neocloeon triangulifer]